MNSNTVIGIIILILVVVGAAVLAMGGDDMSGSQTGVSTGEEAMMAESEDSMMETENSTVGDSADPMMQDEDEMVDDDMDETESSSQTAAQSGVYTAYSSDKLAMAADGDVVLFFKASWCPSCRALDADIRANTAAIPAGVTILEVDFDSSTDLRRQYGVTTQHTLVQVDQNGNELKKWLGGNTLDAVLSDII